VGLSAREKTNKLKLQDVAHCTSLIPQQHSFHRNKGSLRLQVIYWVEPCYFCTNRRRK